MFTSELQYFWKRAREERERAASASTPIMAEIHIALADKYETLLNQPDVREELSGLWRSRDEYDDSEAAES